MTKKKIDRNTNQEGNGLTDIQRTIKEYHIIRDNKGIPQSMLYIQI